MKILSVETSSNICSVAILEDTNIIKENTIDDANTHSVKLMPLIDKTLSEANLTLSDIDLLSCDKGPGSFTGIRIGISTIKAFADVTNKPSYGISSLTALAYQSNFDGLICSLIDAKHDNVYFGLFEHKNEKYIQVGNLLAENVNYVTNILKKCNKPIFFVGNGSIVYKDVLQSVLRENAIIINENQYTNLTAISVGKAAFFAYLEKEEGNLSPMYLRKSNAERNLEEENNAN